MYTVLGMIGCLFTAGYSSFLYFNSFDNVPVESFILDLDRIVSEIEDYINTDVPEPSLLKKETETFKSTTSAFINVMAEFEKFVAISHEDFKNIHAHSVEISQSKYESIFHKFNNRVSRLAEQLQSVNSSAFSVVANTQELLILNDHNVNMTNILNIVSSLPQINNLDNNLFFNRLNELVTNNRDILSNGPHFKNYGQNHIPELNLFFGDLATLCPYSQFSYLQANSFYKESFDIQLETIRSLLQEFTKVYSFSTLPPLQINDVLNCSNIAVEGNFSAESKDGNLQQLSQTLIQQLSRNI